MEHRNHHQARRQFKKRQGFFRHLRFYVIFNGINILVKVSDGDFFGWWPLAFFWGIGLAVHYLSVFGPPGEMRKALPPHFFGGCGWREDREERAVRSWRDRDLV